MESSTVVAFRALVMLACLIVVPLAAIFGSAFPDVVKSLLIDRFTASKESPSADPRPVGEAPVFGKVTDAPPTAPALSSNPMQTAPPNWDMGVAGQPSMREATPAAAVWPETSRPSDDTARAEQFAAQPITGSNLPASFNAPADSTAQPWPATTGAPSAALPTTGLPPNSQPSPAAPPLAGRASDSPGQVIHPTSPSDQLSSAAQIITNPTVGQQTDRFATIEQRLRQAGATYYLLETWGQEGSFYRFICRVSIGNNPHYFRQFEAIDADAMKAMSQVLDQIEAARAGRLD